MYWPLIITACLSEDAVGPRGVLMHSSKLNGLLCGPLNWMVQAVEEFRVVGFDLVWHPVFVPLL
jgi:hypothetical protein